MTLRDVTGLSPRLGSPHGERVCEPVTVSVTVTGGRRAGV
jgi:hypothetical protein